MIRRLATWTRRLVGIVALGLAAWWSVEAVMTWWAFRYLGHRVVDPETGEPAGVRIVPLTAAELAEYDERARFEAAWAASREP